MLKIVQAPQTVLARKAEPVKKIDKDITTLISDMVETLVATHDPEGVGLAAPQVGKNLQLFIIKESKKAPLFVFINPQITIIDDEPKKIAKVSKNNKNQKEDDDETTKLEGCLSLKDIWGTVNRAPKVKVKYLDEKGVNHEAIFNGFMAIIIQHEYDHLQGILFPKRVLEQKQQLYKAVKDKKGEDIFEPIELI